MTSPFSCDILFQDMEKLRNQLDRKEENVHTEKVIHIFLSDEDSIIFSLQQYSLYISKKTKEEWKDFPKDKKNS